MRNRNHDIMGAALGFPVIGGPGQGWPGAWGPGWGGPWGGYPVTAFGVDEIAAGQAAQDFAAQYMARAQAALAPPAGPMMVPGCGYSAAYADPNLVNALILKQHSAIVGTDCGPQEREQMFGNKPVGDLEPNDIVNVEFTPELVCKLTRLFIPTSVASQLCVLDCTIGIKSQFPGKGIQPGLVYSEISTNNRINGDTCYIRQPIVVTVQNCSLTTIPGNHLAFAVGVVNVQGANPQIYGPGSGHQ